MKEFHLNTSALKGLYLKSLNSKRGEGHANKLVYATGLIHKNGLNIPNHPLHKNP